MTTATKTIGVLVSTSELTELATWEKKYSDAKKKVSEAEKELAFRRQSLAEKVLGIKSADDLKALAPDRVHKLFLKRLESGDWRPERGAPEFSFTKSNEGRYPSWSQLYIEELGETAAARVRAETPLTYSYKVEVSL